MIGTASLRATAPGEEVMRRYSKQLTLLGAAAVGLLGVFAAADLMPHADRATASDDLLQHGRYLVQIGGCNDCHTPGYQAKAGDVPESQWLVGDSLGYRGPWGTTYAANLRRLVRTMDENAWVGYARTIETRPPMPWFNLRAFSETDLRAMYRYVRSLPADETSVPDYVPPDRQPTTPHIVMTPLPPKTDR
jgi:mono/diheme cytochrome c family protein